MFLPTITVKRGDLRIKSPASVSKILLDKANRVWKNAVRAGIQAVIDSDVIEVDTGMAKSTLIPMARAVRMVGILRSSIHPVTGFRKGITELSGQWNPGGIKSGSEGEAAGENAFRYVIATGTNKSWTLSFTIPVWHYAGHDIGGLPGTGPWNSLDVMLDGMIDFLQRSLDADDFLPKHLPDLFFFAGEST